MAEQHGSINISREQAADHQGLVADQDLYETRDGRIVAGDDPEANRLVAIAGRLIRPKDVERLGIKEGRMKVSRATAELSTSDTVAASVSAAEPTRVSERKGSVNLTRTKE